MRPHGTLAPKLHELLPRLLALAALVLAFGCNEGGDPSTLSFTDVFGGRLFAPDEAVVEEREGETMLRMVGIAFNTGTAVLTPDSLPVLDKLAEVFEAMPGARIRVEGHTDSAGSAASNLQLSQDRANAVRDYLVEVLGAPPVAFTTAGYGETLPIADNATQIGRSQNRRIEIFVQDDGLDPIFEVSLAADRILVVYDCDDYTSSPSAAAGDFFVQVEFYSDDDRGLVLADRSPNTLALLNDGESSDLDVFAEERFIASDDAVLVAYVDWYESDPDGVHDFDRSEEIPLRYNAGEACWEDTRIIVVVGSGGEPDPRARCIADTNGEIIAGTLSVFQPPTPSNAACVASLDWSLVVEEVVR